MSATKIEWRESSGGDWYCSRNGIEVQMVLADYVPALLRALIAQAGGVEVEVDKYSIYGHHGISGRFMLLPMEGSE